MKLSFKQGLEFRRLGDEGLLLDTDTCKFFQLSPEAVICWEKLTQATAQDAEPKMLAHFHSVGLLCGFEPLELDANEMRESQHVRELEALTAAAQTWTNKSPTWCSSRGGTWTDTPPLGDGLGTCRK